MPHFGVSQLHPTGTRHVPTLSLVASLVVTHSSRWAACNRRDAQSHLLRQKCSPRSSPCAHPRNLNSVALPLLSKGSRAPPARRFHGRISHRQHLVNSVTYCPFELHCHVELNDNAAVRGACFGNHLHFSKTHFDHTETTIDSVVACLQNPFCDLLCALSQHGSAYG